MAADASGVRKANGLNTVLNVITAPREAFATLREAPTWGWAFLITVILTFIGGYLAVPATTHASSTLFAQQAAANPQLAQESPEQRQRILDVQLAVVKWTWLFSPVGLLVFAVIQTVFLLIFNAIGRGQAGFKVYWASSINIAVVGYGLNSLLTGIIALVRGADAYNSVLDIQRSIPSLALLAPGVTGKLSGFLVSFNPLSIWATILVGVALAVAGRTSRPVAIAGAVLFLLIGAGIAAAFAPAAA